MEVVHLRNTHELQCNRWHQHFSSVLNCLEPEIQHDFTDNEGSALVLDVNMNLITEGEVLKAIHRLKNGKAAGIDHIQRELLKYSSAIVHAVTRLCNVVWETKKCTSRLAEWRRYFFP